MKFSQNTRVVSPNTINAKYTAVTDPMAYGQNGKEWDAFGSAVGVGLKVAQKEQDDADAADVLEAKNKIQTALTGAFYGEDGILTNGIGEKAKGMTDRAQKATTETFNDVAKNYNPRVQRVLKRNMGDTLLAYQKSAMQQEQTERKKQDTANYTNLQNDTINKAGYGQNYMDDNLLTQGMNEIKTNTLAYGRLQGWNGKQYEAMTRDAATKYWGTAINAAIADNNPTRAQLILTQHAKEMDQQTVIGLNQKLNDDKEMHIYKNDAKWELDNDKSLLNPDGTYNVEKGRNYVRNVWAKQTVDVTVTEPGTGGGAWFGDNDTNSLIDKYAAKYGVDPKYVAALASIESGGSQDADSGLAHGVMQLTPETAKGLGVDINSKEGNIEGGVKYLSQLLKKYNGNIDLAVAAYNAGPKAVDDYGGIPPYKETQNHVKKFHAALKEMEGKAKPTWDFSKGESLIGQTMANGQLGCTEFVTRYGKLCGNNFLTQEADKGVVRVPDLIRDAGDKFQAFDASKLQAGDIIVYGEDSHVVVYDGNGGYYGNSSGQNKAVHGSDYTQMGPSLHPTGMIKTGGGSGGPVTKVIKKPKFSERQSQEFEQVFMAELNQRNADIQARNNQQMQADADEIMKLDGPGTLAKLKKIKATGNSTRYDNALTAAHKFHPELYAKPTGGGSRGGGSRGGNGGGGSRGGYTGASGIHYSYNEYMKAKDTYRRWENGSTSISQDKADNAAYIINDIEGTTGDNLDVSEGYTVALDVIHKHNYDYDAAIQDLMDNYGYSYTEAKNYVEGAEE